jgi:hypothetical protein
MEGLNTEALLGLLTRENPKERSIKGGGFLLIKPPCPEEKTIH